MGRWKMFDEEKNCEYDDHEAEYKVEIGNEKVVYLCLSCKRAFILGLASAIRGSKITKIDAWDQSTW